MWCCIGCCRKQTVSFKYKFYFGGSIYILDRILKSKFIILYCGNEETKIIQKALTKIIVKRSNNAIGQDFVMPLRVYCTNISTWLFYRLCKRDTIMESSSSSGKTIIRSISSSLSDATSFDLQHKD